MLGTGLGPLALGLVVPAAGLAQSRPAKPVAASCAPQPDCLATIRQKVSPGTTFNHRAIVLADGAGYLYLQTAPDAVTAAAQPAR